MQRGESTYDYVSLKYEFPGGKLEIGESRQQALIREIKEELSYSITNPKHFYEWYNLETKTHITYFLIKLRKKAKFNDIKEGQIGKWFYINDLDTIKLAPDIKAIKSKL